VSLFLVIATRSTHLYKCAYRAAITASEGFFASGHVPKSTLPLQKNLLPCSCRTLHAFIAGGAFTDNPHGYERKLFQHLQQVVFQY